MGFRNKKDERGIVIRNKAKLVAQGHTQEEGIDCDEVFAPVARIEAIRLFLAYASFMGFMVYQMDVKSTFLYETIEEEVYVCQPLGFKDPDYHDKMSSMGELTFFLGLQVKKKDDGIFISQDKYVAEILRKFSFIDVKSASTPIETEKPLLKDPDGEDVDVHIYSEELASPKQTTLGKDYSNPFMAGSLPKTIWHFITTVSYKLMLFGLPKYADVNLMLLGFDQIMDFLNAHTIQKKVVVTEDVIRRDLYLDDADGVECLPNEEIFAELARMGYEKTPPKLAFYKAFFSVQWKFLIHTLVQCVSAKRTTWNNFSCSMASAVICLATGGCIQTGRKIKGIDADEDITLVDVGTLEEEVEKVAAREKQEKDDLERAQVLQKQYEDKEENIDWNAVVDHVQERHLDNIRKYQNLKKKPVRPIFKREHKKVQTLFNPDKDVEKPKKKRVVEKTLLQESFKKLKAVKVSGYEATQEDPSNDPKEIKKDYPLSNGVMTLMLSAKLQVEEDSKMARDLVMKIFMEANKPKSRSLNTSSK
uniref:Copia protein n=1 Tax=Tanacetum cinerariifolium TaxID=118510 RepID=A0A6L2KD50_TANCI|nr:copia protein [Tanacetum cinerariifolium]